jgi:hypothetical protein
MILFFIGCTAKTNISVETKPIQPEQQVEKETTIPPNIKKSDIPIPQMPSGLPTWDSLTEPSTVFEPVAALALSFDHKKCFKEWFQGDSLPPNIRKHQGRILNENEGSIGRLIQCPNLRKETLLKALLTNPE